jgi:AcrR family transcriptional regulator
MKRAKRTSPTQEAARKPRDEARRVRTDLYRQHIFAAAEQVFAARGYEAAKVQEISERAGLSMGTIYAIFPSKVDLLGAILDARGRDILDLVRRVVGAPTPARETLRRLIEAYVTYFAAHPDFLRMHLRQGISWVASPDADRRMQIWKEIHALQADVFRRGIQEGVFANDDPAFLARLFSAMDQVLLADWVESGMSAAPAALIDRFLGLVERAFGATPGGGPLPAST